jgi:DNA-binding MarR family transcriptional regulator
MDRGDMGVQQQHHLREQAVQKLRAADQLLTQGAPVCNVAQKLASTEQTYQQWRMRGTPSNTRPQPTPAQEIAKGNSESPAPSPPQKFPVRREESWEMFGLFVDAVQADVAVTRIAPPSDVPLTISPKLVRALLYLAQHGGRALTVGELAEGVGVSLGWASRVADELVSLGLLERMRNEHDRRVVQLQLTPRATVISARLWTYREDAILTALGETLPEQRPVIARFLRKLTAELELHAAKSGRY